MALKFTNTGKGTLGDILAGWSVNEYATPFTPGDSSSSTTTASYTGGYTDESFYLTDKSVTITHVPDEPEHPSLGSMTGRIQSNNLQGASVAISQATIATQLNVDRVAQALTPGRYVGGRYIANGKNKFPQGGIQGQAASPDGRYVYLVSQSYPTFNPGNNTSWPYFTKWDMNTNKVVWANDASVGGVVVAPNNVNPRGTFTLADGRIAFSAIGAIGAGSVQISFYRPTDGHYDTAWNVAPPSGASVSAQPFSSPTPDNNIFWVQSWWERPSSTVATARNRVFKTDLLGNILLDSGNKTIATTNDDGTPSTSAVFIVAKQAIALTDDRFIANGPIVAGQTRFQGWAIYQLTAGVVTLLNDLTTVTVSSTNIPTNQDKYGNFVIGATLFDTDGNVLFDFSDNVAQFTSKFNNGNGASQWSAIGQTTDGNTTYFTTNYDYPLTLNTHGVPGFNGDPSYKTSAVRFDQVDTSVSLSDVFSYYFGLVLGARFSYPINYIANDNPIVTLAGWNGNVWDHICQLCVAFKVELVFVNGVPTVRDIASTVLDVTEVAQSPSLSPSAVGNARKVSLSYNNATPVSTSATPTKYVTNLMTNPTARTNSTGYASFIYGVVSRSSGVVKTGQTSIKVTGSGTAQDSRIYGLYGSNPIFGVNTTGDRMIGLSRGTRYHLRANVWKPAKSQPYVQFDASMVGRIAIIQYDKNKNVSGVSYTTLTANARGDFPVSADFTVASATVDIAVQLQGSPVQDTHFYNLRITKYGVEAPGFPQDKYFDGSTRGWSWTGTANNSKSQIVFPGKAADNIIFDAYKQGNQTFSVDVLGSETTTVDIGVYVSTFKQPVASNSLNFVAGTYYVSAADNLPVVAAQWLAYGGSVVVAINKDDPKSIDVTVNGPVTPIPGVAGPFSLSASDGQNNYAIFSLIGTGVRVTQKVLTLGTGVDNDKVTQQLSGQVDNFAVNTLQDAYDMGYILSEANGAATQELSLSIPIARISGFGVTPGARFTYAGNMYRITQVTIGNSMVQITAVRYITVDDVGAWYDGLTALQVATLWAGYTAHDTIMRPLKQVS